MPSRRRPPTFIPGMPSCQPLITPLSEKVAGWPREYDESKILPVEQDTPMYWTVTLAPLATSAPVPTTRSLVTRAVGGGPTTTGTAGAPFGRGSATATQGRTPALAATVVA